MEDAPEKPDRGQIPGVAVDGSCIRGIREGKKLTQLYVANVVGVTTDTISRWENNRYPSIKRENAEKLARALEVELAEILRRDEVPSGADVAAPPASGRGGSLWAIVAAGVLTVVFIAGYLFLPQPTPAPSAIRWAPGFAAPGEVIPVQIKVTRPKGENYGFILKEKIPDGFRLISSLPPSSASDAAGSGIKWLIPSGTGPVTVSYTIQVPPLTPLAKEAKFSGEIVLTKEDATRTESIAGAGRVRIGPYHWADSNGDGRIDDDEIMPAYYVCEDMKGMGLDWKTIESIWSGKGYRWDPRSGFTVIR